MQDSSTAYPRRARSGGGRFHGPLQIYAIHAWFSFAGRTTKPLPSNLTRFEDSYPLEGVTTLVERNATRNSELQKWYDSNKNYTFVTCLVLSNCEYDYMWREYAGGDAQDGLMLKTTVGRLKAELSCPPYRGPLLPSDAYPCDAFTVGLSSISMTKMLISTRRCAYSRITLVMYSEMEGSI